MVNINKDYITIKVHLYRIDKAMNAYRRWKIDIDIKDNKTLTGKVGDTLTGFESFTDTSLESYINSNIKHLEESILNNNETNILFYANSINDLYLLRDEFKDTNGNIYYCNIYRLTKDNKKYKNYEYVYLDRVLEKLKKLETVYPDDQIYFEPIPITEREKKAAYNDRLHGIDSTPNLIRRTRKAKQRGFI